MSTWGKGGKKTVPRLMCAFTLLCGPGTSSSVCGAQGSEYGRVQLHFSGNIKMERSYSMIFSGKVQVKEV